MRSLAGKPPLRADCNHSLRTVSQPVEWLLLRQSAAIRNGRQHPPQYGLPPRERASELFLPPRQVPTRRPLAD